jgi:hypothetical protein
MKINIKIALISWCAMLQNYTVAQSFEKNDKIIEAGFGLGIYDTKIYQKSNKTSETSKAAAWVFPLSIEYAVANRLAIGIGYKYSNYIIGNEDTANTNAKINGNDIILKPTFHLIKSKRINIYVGALAGMAWFNYQVNDKDQSFAKGNGTLLAFVFGTRLYVAKNIGLSLNYTFNNYNFVDLTLANNNGYSDKLDLTLKRGNVGLGLVFKFN